ncbi:RNA polymerase factor sigma-54 [Umboniibacter marinipuniceus]|uniref:RNA polymerase sigma-54 factor n=1 Tax=Umboniibacter marinipuniceus TaxID=569599 RepID=A0A3M0AAM8_9GAMM|nr:RNA polymerase factor sigma-54 [Umboniibacter marinipuniceus]RMA79445.1 RNA polymerase RpoN-/SigL-like sigma 54 subunit [Umboniibacter marinipuniceus]
MKQSLQLKTSLKMTMTPQLQLAVKVLQLSTLDLQAEIQDTLDRNPLLDVEDSSPALPSESNSLSNEQRDDNSPDSYQLTESASEPKWEKDIPSDMPVDSQWDDVYSGGPAKAAPENDFDFLANRSQDASLQDHLSFQLAMKPLSIRDRLIGDYLIDSINSNGWLTAELASIADDLNRHEETDDNEFEIDEVEAILHLIQSFDPIGVGARDLGECIALQLSEMDPKHPTVARAIIIASNHMPAILKQDFKKLAKLLKCSEGELELSIDLIQQQNPHPGDSFSESDSEYVIPDVLVSLRKDLWHVEINPDVAPRLCVNREYSALIKRGDASDDNKFLRENLQQAQWFIKSVESRFDTLFNVASAIVERQRAFFDYGPEAMKPMVLADVAEELGLAESTISRATAGKYMLTPRGVFELKYFFSSHVSSDSGDTTSATAIKAFIKKLVESEPPNKPLSDAKLMALLEADGVKVARRTVAKYREAIGIAPSSQRKRLK